MCKKKKKKLWKSGHAIQSLNTVTTGCSEELSNFPFSHEYLFEKVQNIGLPSWMLIILDELICREDGPI